MFPPDDLFQFPVPVPVPVSAFRDFQLPNPQSEMTMADAISTIERDLGPMYVGRVLVRGQHIPRAQLRNYKATDLLRENEAFNMYLAAKCTIL